MNEVRMLKTYFLGNDGPSYEVKNSCLHGVAISLLKKTV